MSEFDGAALSTPTDDQTRRALVVIATAQLLVLSLWFSASAVTPGLKDAWALTDDDLPLLTQAVQLGFVVGALGLAVSAMADRVPARRLFAVSATIGAVANLGLVTLGPGQFTLAVFLRFVTGATLAGVYPSGMRAVAGWFVEKRGMAFGVLIGALTVGSALPNLIRQLGLEWRGVLGGASLLAGVGAVAMSRLDDGPHAVPSVGFEWGHLGRVLGNRGFRLATAGYLGHMWELYAMWTWIGAFLAASVAGSSLPTPLVTFVVIGVGGLGSWIAGRLADRHGRTVVAGGSLIISGLVAAMTPLVFQWPTWAAVAAALIWGATVVSDSAQFSAMVTEIVDGDIQGTALTLQTALGFLLTIASIGLTSLVALRLGWQWAFLPLLPGPVLGVWAMFALRRSEYSLLLAQGRG